MSTTLVVGALASPPDLVGPRLLALAEDQYFERKAVNVSPERLAHLEIGFANADGGIAVVGLREGVVEGISREPRRVNALLQAAYDFSAPVVPHRVERVPCVNAAGEPDELIAIHVEPSRQVHANNKDEVYLRVGDETRKLSYDQRRELVFDKGQATYEAERVPGTSFADIDEANAREYATAVKHPDPVRLFDALGFTDQGVLTVAGTMLFATYPQRWFPEAFVRVIRYRGIRRDTGAAQNIEHDERCEGSLRIQLDKARSLVRRWQPRRRALGRSGRFEWMPLIPEDAWLEALVNAVAHRAYSIVGDHIRVEVFDDRMEISSPGRFPGLVRLDDPLNTVRFARNPRVARVLSDLDFGQELGEGIRRMFAEMRAAGLTDPLYFQTAGSVVVTLSTEPADRALDATLPDETRAIVAALREADRLSTGDVARLLGLSRPPTIRKLATLREAGVIEWMGNAPQDPRAYWRLPR